MAFPDAASISRRTPERASTSRPWRATLAPCRAKLLAMAAPIPRELPVTSATLFLSSVMGTPVGDCAVHSTTEPANGQCAQRSVQAPLAAGGVGVGRDP